MASNSQTRISERAANEAAARERLRQALPATVDHLQNHQAVPDRRQRHRCLRAAQLARMARRRAAAHITGRNICAQLGANRLSLATDR